MSELPEIQLSVIETRILGCLCEKEVTTPDNYPLSQNSLTNACNQKSNRHPVLALEEPEVAAGLESLRIKKLVLVTSQAGSHVAKYRHNFEGTWKVTPSERAILSELLLRGPQTPGELRTRCERMQPIATLDDAREKLEALATRSEPLVVQLPKQPGRKDHRWIHLFSGTPTETTEETPNNEPLKVEVAMTIPPEVDERLKSLEDELATLRTELATFKAQFD